MYLRGSADGTFAPSTPIALPGLTANPPEQKGQKSDKDAPQAYVSGLAVSLDGQTLFAANFATDTVFAIGLPGGDVKATRQLDTLAHPYCLRLSPDGSELYVTEGALKRVEALRVADLTTARILPTEAHPNDLLFAPDGRLFVSCGSSDSVLVLDAKTGQQTERISVTLTPRSPAGATPNALALAPDGKTLYVADSDNNDVAVIDVAQSGRSRVRGFIPTGWYPTLVCATPDGKNLLIGSGKGMGAGPNANANSGSTDPVERHYTYVGTLLYGMIATLAVPHDARACRIHAAGNGEHAVPRRADQHAPCRAPSRQQSHSFPRGRCLADQIRALHHQGEPHLRSGAGGHTRRKRRSAPDVVRSRRSRPTSMLWPASTCCWTTPIATATCPATAIPGVRRAYGTDIGERAWMQAYGSHADWPLKDPDIYPPVGRIWDRCEQKGLPWASYYFTWTTDNTRKNMPAAWANDFDKRREFENADVFNADLKRYEQHNNLPRFHDYVAAGRPHERHKSGRVHAHPPASPPTIWAWARWWPRAAKASSGPTWRFS